MEVIDVNRKVLEQSKELEVTSEVIVPDVKPDIVSIICSNGLAYIHKQEVLNGACRFSGNIEVTVCYLSSNGDTRSLQTVLDFNQKSENNAINENSLLKYDIEVQEINSKMLNERKIIVTAKLEIKYKIYEKQELKFYNDFNDIQGLQKQEETLTLNSIIGVGSSKASLNEKIEVENTDIVSEILKTDVNILNTESKMSYNKILAKAEVNINLIYSTEDGRINCVSETFPVMSFVEISNVKEDSICDLDYKIKNMVLKINNNENHGIECQIDFEIIAEAFDKREINIVNDLYSLKNDLDYTKEVIEIEVDNDKNVENVKIDEKIEIPNVKRVFAFDERLEKGSSWEMDITIYYETTEKSGLNVKNIKVPIMVKTNDGYLSNISNKEFEVENNNVLIKMELEIKQDTSNSKSVPLIQDVKIKEGENKEDYSVVVYFVKPNDTVWTIAKKFKVTVESIIRINNLQNPDIIYPGDKLYVLK